MWTLLINLNIKTTKGNCIVNLTYICSFSHGVDHPLSVLDLLLSWGHRHTLFLGLNFTRLRLQGRIEGNVNSSVLNSRNLRSDYDSPHAAPVSVKGRRYIDLNNDIDEVEEQFGR
ncbi:unnamed protein product [Brassica oleracea]